MEILWWKIGFTPRAIRRVRRNWLVSSSGVISSYFWVLSLKIGQFRRKYSSHIPKVPLFGASDDHLWYFLFSCGEQLTRDLWWQRHPPTHTLRAYCCSSSTRLSRFSLDLILSKTGSGRRAGHKSQLGHKLQIARFCKVRGACSGRQTLAIL